MQRKRKVPRIFECVIIGAVVLLVTVGAIQDSKRKAVEEHWRDEISSELPVGTEMSRAISFLSARGLSVQTDSDLKRVSVLIPKIGRSFGLPVDLFVVVHADEAAKV